MLISNSICILGLEWRLHDSVKGKLLYLKLPVRQPFRASETGNGLKWL